MLTIDEMFEVIFDYAEDHPNFNTAYTEKLFNIHEAGGTLSGNQKNALINIIEKFRMEDDYER